jgi:hypothetical protein
MIRQTLAFPIAVVGLCLLGIGLTAMMASHYISPKTSALDRWIDRLIDGPITKSPALCGRRH